MEKFLKRGEKSETKKRKERNGKEGWKAKEKKREKKTAWKNIKLWRMRFIQRRNEIFNDYIAVDGAYCSRVDCAPLPTPNSIGGYIMRLMGFRFSYKSHPPLGVNINHFPRGNNAAGREREKKNGVYFYRRVVASSSYTRSTRTVPRRECRAFKAC